MKLRTFYLFILVLAMASSQQACSRNIKGNKKVSDHVVNISAYNNIEIAARVDFEYEQSEGEPYLCITIDDNLFEYIDVTESAGVLKIGVKRSMLDKKSYIFPSVFRIRSNSRELKQLVFSGLGKFTVEKPFTGKRLELIVSGKGNIDFKNVNVNELACEVSGVCDIKLAGKATHAFYDVSGVAKVKAYDCESETVEANLSGVGKVEVYASSELKADCSGVSKIRHKGNPNVISNKSGVASISAAR